MRTLILLVITIGFTGCATRIPEAPARADVGDDIVVVDYWVATDNKTEFERFLVEVLMPALGEYYPDEEQPVRLWTATEASDEGTFQYRFVVDPVDELYPFDVEAILEGMYPSEGEEYAEQFEGFVEDDEEMEFQQSRWH